MNDNPVIKAVAFDMDGLMFDTEDLYTVIIKRFISSKGATYDPAIKNKVMGMQAHKAVALTLEHHGLEMDVDEAIAEQHELIKDYFPANIQKMPGLDECLSAVESAGLPKALTTSSNLEHVGYGFDKFELHSRFNFKLTAENVTNGKPDPEIYLKAADNFGVDPANMLVLEDSPAGMAAGVAAGAVVVGIPSLEVADQEFEDVHFLAESLADERLLELIATEAQGNSQA